jgi:multidrug efflux pump subunit AcrB
MSALNLSALAVRERAITLFLIVAIIISGAYAFVRLGRAEDPSFVAMRMRIFTRITRSSRPPCSGLDRFC